MATHATTKFKWTYLTKSGKLLKGNFFVPIGEEGLAEDWFKRVVASDLDQNEQYDPESGSLVDFGSDHKIR